LRRRDAVPDDAADQASTARGQADACAGAEALAPQASR
jgi:hypothetical protein